MSITEWNEFSYKILHKNPGYTMDIYIIEKLSGDWPCKDDLINLCNGNIPGSYNDGGNLHIYGTRATIDVYID